MYIGLWSDLIFRNPLSWKVYFYAIFGLILMNFYRLLLIDFASCMKSFITKIKWRFRESFNKIISSIINK